MKRPDFDTFREMFLDCLGRETKLAGEEKRWVDIGEPATRRKILESVNRRLKKGYSIEFEINQRLLSVEGTVESAIIQTFHELSTINIMERINAKIRGRLN